MVEQYIADRVLHFYLNITDRKQYQTEKHFEKVGEKGVRYTECQRNAWTGPLR